MFYYEYLTMLLRRLLEMLLMRMTMCLPLKKRKR